MFVNLFSPNMDGLHVQIEPFGALFDIHGIGKFQFFQWYLDHRRLVSRHPWPLSANPPKIVSCSSSWTSCRCKIANGQTVEIRGLYWNDESTTSSKLVVYLNLTDMCIHFHRSFNKRHGLPHEWLGISLQSARSVISLAISLLYLPIFSSLFSRVFSWSKSLPFQTQD